MCLQLAFLIVYLAVMIAIGVIDTTRYIIPNKIVFPLAALGVIYQLLYGSIKDMLIGFTVSFALGLITWLASKGGMGAGDVKLMAVIGLWLGYESFLLITFVASFLGIIWAIIDYLRQKRFKEKTKDILMQLKLIKYVGLSGLNMENKDMKKPIPFGGCLALATFIVYFRI